MNREDREALALSDAIDARLREEAPRRPTPGDLGSIVNLLTSHAETVHQYALPDPLPRPYPRWGRRFSLALPVALLLALSLVVVPVVARSNVHHVGDTVVIEGTPAPRLSASAAAASNPLEEMSLAEAEQRAGFTVPLPTALPKGYTMKTVKLADAQTTHALSTGIIVRYGKLNSPAPDRDDVVLMYDHFVGHSVPCVLRDNAGNPVCAKYYSPATTGSVRDVQIGDIPGILIQSDFTELDFERDDMRISIAGHLSAEEMLRIASSLR